MTKFKNFCSAFSMSSRIYSNTISSSASNFIESMKSRRQFNKLLPKEWEQSSFSLIFLKRQRSNIFMTSRSESWGNDYQKRSSFELTFFKLSLISFLIYVLIFSATKALSPSKTILIFSDSTKDNVSSFFKIFCLSFRLVVFQTPF